MNTEEMIQEILNPANAFTTEQLHAISDALNARFRAVQRLQAAAFRVGEKVSFVDRQGVTLIGNIKKVNPKNILVAVPNPTGFERVWTISPGLLSKAI